MRRAFVETLCAMAREDERIILLTGDLGFMALEPFRDEFPERFFNVGVAEQNMTGIAAGLAEAGLRPYVYSIATFASLRPFEFIRNGPVLHRLPVRIVGMGAGFDYGHAGATHYAVEDVAVLRTMPGLRIAIPCDSGHAAAMLRATANQPGPVYYSLSKDDSLRGILSDPDGAAGLHVLGGDSDLLILAMGAMVSEALEAAKDLPATVGVVCSFHPDPRRELAELLPRYRRVVTVEAQTVSGGLGAFVASVIAEEGLPCQLRALAVREPHDGLSGSQRERRARYGIDARAIIEAAR